MAPRFGIRMKEIIQAVDGGLCQFLVFRSFLCIKFEWDYFIRPIWKSDNACGTSQHYVLEEPFQSLNRVFTVSLCPRSDNVVVDAASF